MVVAVDRGPAGEILHLALAHRLPGGPRDRLDRAVKGAARGLHSGETAHAVGVLLGGQVQQAVGGMQVRLAQCAVGAAAYRDLTEDRRELTSVPGLDSTPAHAIGGDDLDPDFLEAA
ncbi:MAG: hypothetical protein ACYDAG_16155 [Chloroflexota bacterium]